MSGTTTTPPPDDLEAAYRQLYQQTVAPTAAPVPQGPTASSHEGRGFLSLLGEALGGGQQYGTPAERERGGISALGAMGQRMLEASDYSYNRHSLGSIIGQGMGAAQQSLAGTQQVSAAQQAALQDYQKTQQEMSLARVKEALPILTQLQTLRQADAARRIALGGGTPGTTPGTSIAGAGPGGPGTAPINEAGDSATRKASEGGPPAPGTPGAAVAQQVHDFWISKGFSEDQVAGIMAGGPGSESNFNPTASGDKGSSYGLYQHHAERLDAMRQHFGLTGSQMPSADQQNQYAYWEITQGPYAKSVGEPLKAAKTPGEAAAIWTQYFGVPADKTEIGRRALGAGRFAGLYTPKAPPGAPAVAASTTPPAAAVAPGGGVALTPPGAPQPSPTGAIAEATRAAEVGPLPLPATAGKATPLPAGNLQTTGKPPGVASNVEAMQAGVNLAQATPVVPGTGLAAGPPGIGQPATLASVVPGGGTGFVPTATPAGAASQAQQPPAVVPQGQPAATPPAVTTPSVEPFVYNRGLLPPTIQSRLDNPGAFVSPDLTAALQVAAASGNIGEMAKAKAAVGAAADMVRAEAAKEAEAYHTNERNKAQEFRQKQIDNQQAIQLKQIEADNNFRMKEEEGRQQRLSSTQAADIARQEKRMEAIETAGGASRSSLDDLDMLRALSNSVGTASPWSQIEVGGRKIQDWMTRFQIGSPESRAQMGNQQAYEAVVNKIIVGLRSGVSMGNLSDKDLGFIRDQAPSIMQDPKTRGNIIGFLEQVYQRKLDYAQTVSKYYRPGTTSVAEAEAKADQELGPILKQVPRYSDLTGDAQRNAKDLWIYQNIRPGTFYKSPGGKLVPYNPPPGWQPAGAEAD